MRLHQSIQELFQPFILPAVGGGYSLDVRIGMAVGPPGGEHAVSSAVLAIDGHELDRHTGVGALYTFQAAFRPELVHSHYIPLVEIGVGMGDGPRSAL